MALAPADISFIEMQVCQGSPLCDDPDHFYQLQCEGCPWCKRVLVDDETRTFRVLEPGNA